MTLSKLIILWLLTITTALANNITIDGTVKKSIPSKNMQYSYAQTMHTVTLLRMKLNNAAQAALQQRMRQIGSKNLLQNVSILPKSHQLGMGNVPVLDQGNHGTCVTFATTGAIDAIIQQGDYVSQLCPLQLGKYLADNAYTVSGWDGAWGDDVLSKMSLFGLVAKDQEASCSATSSYPVLGPEPDETLSLVDYHAVSQSLDNFHISWSSILDNEKATTDHFNDTKFITSLKQILLQGDRMTVGMILLDYNKGTAGAIGTHNVTNDTWVLTPSMVDDYTKNPTDVAGHELIITGYDDTATAVDNEGIIHQGLFTVRNSWGATAGDDGDFYVSYDYMKSLAIEVLRLSQM